MDVENVRETDPRRELFDRVCLSCLSYLDNFEECSSVVFNGQKMATSHELDLWEKQNLPYQLPEDMKSFYRMFDGFAVHFGVNTGSGTAPLTVGTMRLGDLKAIKRLPLEGQFPGLADISTMTSAAFLLDDSMEDGNIVLLYRSAADRELCVVSSDGVKGKDSSTVGIGKSGSTNSLAAMTASSKKPLVDSGSNIHSPEEQQMGFENPEIWFQDRSARWHFMSRSFSDFLRVMVVHLGIDGWVMAFTPEGIPQITRQWMGVFNRERLCLDMSVKL